ncbi:MAG TPA: phosphate ABC transporter permease subunit PstC [Acidimicrobiales bacterium]|nr:phosphate ABC transporter permease subunit PstC [Acidimicrobiales bacterium]
MAIVAGSTGLPASPPASGVHPIRRSSLAWRIGGAIRANEEQAWRWSARVASLIPLGALAFVLTVLAVKAWPAIKVNGVGFLTSSSWKPGNTYGATVHTDGVAHPLGASYGAWPMIAGTLQTSAIAVALAVPISIGAAFALTERLPRWLSQPLGFAIEVLAGIPSVIIGLWGVLTLGPFLSKHVYPIVADQMPDVPVLRYFRNPTGHGEGLLTSGIVLALMIVPIIASTTRDLFLQVPPLPKEGAEALGMTDAEVARRVTVPWVRAGIIGATVLGLGRALGETIAVAMISGSILGSVAPNIYGTMTTIAATIVTQLDSAATDGTGFATATLAEAGLLLAVISVVVNLIARGIVVRTSRLGAPVGRA